LRGRSHLAAARQLVHALGVRRLDGPAVSGRAVRALLR
jgi:hypothetical protein